MPAQSLENAILPGNTPEAFTLSSATFSAITPQPNPYGITLLSVGGISNTGLLTGAAFPSSTGTGYVLSPTTFQIFSASSEQTIPHGVNSSGTVVGEVSGASPGSIGGFTYSNGVVSYIGLPDERFYPAIRGRGINDAGDIVGSYISNTSGQVGFIIQNGVAAILQIPGTSALTAYGVNTQDQIVGSVVTGTPSGPIFVDVHLNGFFESMGSYTLLNVPGSSSTIAEAINDSGQIVGTYKDSGGVSHGFLATQALDVPEPASAAVLAGGVLALIVRRRSDGMGSRPGLFGK